MNDLIDDLNMIPLSGDDLVEICCKLGKPKGSVMWTTYSDLHKRTQLFPDGVDSIFVLMQPPNSQVGHWDMVGRNTNDVFFYDPYSLSLAESIEISKQDDMLPQLIMKAIGGNESLYDENKFKHQNFGKGKDINTCGRHTVFRAFHSWMTNKQYNDFVIDPLVEDRDVKNPDVLVNLITGFLSKSDSVVEQFLMKAVASNIGLDKKISIQKGHSKTSGGSVFG